MLQSMSLKFCLRSFISRERLIGCSLDDPISLVVKGCILIIDCNVGFWI